MVVAFVFGLIIGVEAGMAIMRIIHVLNKDKECMRCLEYAEKLTRIHEANEIKK